MTSSSLTKDKYFHEESSQKIGVTQKSHLIVRLTTFQIYQTSVSVWDLLYFWWNVYCLSSLWRTGGLKCRMPAFSEDDHHDSCKSIPFTIWLVDVSSTPLFSQPSPRYDQHPNGNLLCCNNQRIRYTIFSFHGVLPNDIIAHGHEDNSSLKLLRFTLKCCHHLLILSDNSQCSEPWVFPLEFHRFSINSIQFFERACFKIPLNFVFPSLKWVWTDVSQ